MTTAHTVGALPGAHVKSPLSCVEAFQRELDYLCRTLRRLGVPSADVEDLVHEIFLVLARRWDDYDPSRPLRPYVFGIALRTAKAYQRRRARERPQAALDVEDLASWPDEALDRQQARELVLRALQHLPLERRAVLILHDIDELGMRDIASALSIPVFTGYSRLRKARQEFEVAVRRLQVERRQP
jgi:RNA polymerase sigma-70 factor (ECF subfamily)